MSKSHKMMGIQNDIALFPVQSSTLRQTLFHMQDRMKIFSNIQNM